MLQTYLEARQFKNMFLAGVQNLAANKESVNALNVFPVPDGDTGTNMSLTVLAAAREVEKLEVLTIKALAQAIATGALMGARGNSGVILSQLFRGFGQVLENADKIDGAIIAEGCENAVKVAYRAVIKPVEGTILTVAKAIAKGAKEAVGSKADVASVIGIALEHGRIALAKTPEMLPTLAQAGVVDAGGEGLCLIIEGAFNSLTNQDQAVNLAAQVPIQSAKRIDSLLAKDQKEQGDLKYQYCTELIIKGQGLSQESIRQSLKNLGDCLLVVGTDTLTKIHIHTNRPGKVLELAVELGKLHDIKIDNMAEQHQNKLLFESTEEAKPLPKTLKSTGIVAVSAGDGLNEILKSLGVDVLINGGQTMNPSTEDLLAAIKETNAQQVYILPNNKNIILAAEQAKELVKDVEVIVIPSKTFPQGMAALLAFNPDSKSEDNKADMCQALQNIQSAEITYAVRDSQVNGLEIQAGEVIGIIENNIVEKGQNINEVMKSLIYQMVKKGGELLSLFYGSDVKETEAEKLSAELAAIYPDLEIECHYGGQPLYYYIVSLE
ncbi:DAK2 domain-containing protein [Bacillota bacterium LX-D]|nr:DAK2 domain-containing protein [Bacillota bacterium LX-D]